MTSPSYSRWLGSGRGGRHDQTFNQPWDIKQVLTAKFESAQLYTGILFNNAAIAVAYIGAAAVSNGIEYLNTVNTPRAKTLSQAQASIETSTLLRQDA